MPDTLTPQQMMALQGSQSTNNLPDTLTPAQMAALQGGQSAPTPGPSYLPNSSPLNIADNAGKFLIAHNAPGSVLGQTLGTWGGYLQTKLGDMIHGTNNAKFYDTSTPTLLQNAGDLANSAILGAGMLAGPEADAGILGAEGAAESAVPRALSLLPKGQVAQGVALGAGSGAAQSLAAGTTDPTQVAKDAAAGGAFGGVLGFGGRVLGGIGSDIRQQAVPDQIANVLKEFSANPATGQAELGRYVNAAVAHTSDIRASTPTGLASEDVQRAGDIIQKKISSAGKAIGSALQTEGSNPISLDVPSVGADGKPQTQNVLQGFLHNVEDMFGHGVADENPVSLGKATPVSSNDPLKASLNDFMAQHEGAAFSGEEPSLSPLAGRARQIAPADQKRILDVYDQLKQLQTTPTVQTASDIMHNLDDKIDWTKVDQFGVNHDPLQGLLMHTRGTLNDAVRQASPAVAVANDAFSTLKDIDGQIGQFAGKDLQRGALLLRRVFSGDQSKNSLALLDGIKQATGIDLTKSAVLAKFATDTFGDASQQTLLRQQISGAVNNSPSLVGSARQLIRGLTRGAERVLTPDPMQYATNLVKGNPRVPYGLVGMPGTGLDKVISTISPELQRMGLNAGHAEEAAKRLFKVYLIDRFAQPNSVTGTGQ